jgi:beta-N-acetylhexosaminidase
VIIENLIFERLPAQKTQQRITKSDLIVMRISYSVPVSFFLILSLYGTHFGQVLLKNEEQLLPLKNLESFDLEVYGRVDTLLHTAWQYTNYYKEQHLPYRTQPSHRVRFFIVQDEASLEKAAEKAVDGRNIVCFAGIQAVGLDWADAIIDLVHSGPESMSRAIQGIFGGLNFSDRLRVTRGAYQAGAGLETAGPTRLTFPGREELLHYQPLKDTLDKIAMLALDSMAFPGAQLLVVHQGRIVVMEEYGCHTYDGCIPVRPTDLYDMASVTKTATATLALMQLYDQRRIDLDKTLCDYLPMFCGSDAGRISLRDALTHQSGLKASIVFWRDTYRKNGSFKGRTYKPEESVRYPIRLHDQLYLHRRYKKRIYKTIRRSDLDPSQGYVYSDLGFVIFPEIIKRITGERIDTFMYRHFYDRLGADRLTFRPTERYSLGELVPTEQDTFFRHNLVHGFVHDESSAMLDGLSANAGLFANALDLAKLWQMVLNQGNYGGERYFSPETVAEFTRYQFQEKGNRRALGFDKPLLEYREGATYVARSASPESFGHTGYTGTYYWVDPAYETVFILFTNRVHPTRASSKLFSLNIRPRMLQAVYDFLDGETGAR